MKRSRVKQFDIIRETDPDVFKAKLNEAMKRLAGDNPQMKIDISGSTLDALIEYSEEITVEQPKDEDTMISFTCEDCPFFSPVIKSDGSPDLRIKWGTCPHADMHRTWKRSQACGILYKMIKNGDIRLTLIDTED